MYAIIKTGGKQYKVSTGETLRVERLDREVGSELEITDVLMVVNGSDIKIGNPLVKGATVLANVTEHGLGKKILMMKKKRRKGYQIKKGHRQPYTTIEIKDIRV
ncbi:MAG: 50S ribosomal protein L21 [Dissulfurimicrobium sp.]|uniref:50S ribosomal protein L21 n=1 Tax=Dissulfurimicrobium TaxID=1769732 RepID=UPI001EDB2F08|nr:50S ribosomal protein L21 [Dissulfurimicrobium hydrothermale]UKL13921.1 50S ribosomal protein L21 [Dissulfurimicrobium hydrothermale]